MTAPLRLLAAFAWLRWRLIANALRAAERRDTLERISRVTALLAPGLFLATSIASVLAAIGIGAFGGWISVTHALQTTCAPSCWTSPFWFLPGIRVVLLLATVFALFVPLVVGAHGGAARFTRLLLLPIAVGRLHFIEVVTTLADPWLVFVAPGLIAYALGLLTAGVLHPKPWVPHSWMPGAVALIAGLGISWVLASASALVSFLVSWIVRDRRRSELFVVVLVLSLSGLSIVPALMSNRVDVAGDVSRVHTRSFDVTQWPAWTRALPSELFAEAVSAGFGPREPMTAYGTTLPVIPIVALIAEGAVLYGLSAIVYRRLLESAQGGRGRRRRLAGPAVSPRIPGLWPGTSAVAVAQMRTALRSVRGRLVVLLPGPLVAMMALVFDRIPAARSLQVMYGANGPMLLAAGIMFALYAAQPFTMNQFGTDRAGLTLQFLAPIRDVDLIRGKALGCGAIIAAGTLVTLMCAVVMAPGGPLALWIAALEGGVATYLLIAPLAAWFSALFPVAADLSKTGTGGNPHTLAMLGGMIFVAAAAIPEVLIVAALSPLPALVVMTIWTAVVWVVVNLLLGVTARSLRARRENLALIAQSR